MGTYLNSSQKLLPCNQKAALQNLQENLRYGTWVVNSKNYKFSTQEQKQIVQQRTSNKFCIKNHMSTTDVICSSCDVRLKLKPVMFTGKNRDVGDIPDSLKNAGFSYISQREIPSAKLSCRSEIVWNCGFTFNKQNHKDCSLILWIRENPKDFLFFQR
jgi:hypothetical protein